MRGIRFLPFPLDRIPRVASIHAPSIPEFSLLHRILNHFGTFRQISLGSGFSEDSEHKLGRLIT